MFSKNLKYYRLKNGLSMKELAQRIQVTPMAISQYEDGSRYPSTEKLNALAKALGVRVSDFLIIRNSNLHFKHGEFRKNAAFGKEKQNYVRESVEEYFDRFMTSVEILGGDILPDAPKCHCLPLEDDDEINAAKLREHLGFSKDGPIEELIGKLENKGVLIYACQIHYEQFSGINGFVNDRPYIAYNPDMSTERNRSTIAHELSHLMFIWPADMDEKVIEKRATAISGAFLFPKSDALRELGIRRSMVSRDMLLVAKEYGISMMMLVKRANICGILNGGAERKFYMAASAAGWKKAEPTRIEPEIPSLFAQLVYRAVNEQEISIQRGAELLQRPYKDIAAMVGFQEV